MNIYQFRCHFCKFQIEHSTTLYFAGSFDPCAMVQIESIGGEANAVIGPLTKVIYEIASIPQDRVFANFQGSYTLTTWGINGSTFS